MLPENITSLPYFYSAITQVAQANIELGTYINQDGSFLLRESSSVPGTLTISVVHSKRINHLNIAYGEQGYHLYDTFFAQPEDLIGYYGSHDVPNKENVAHIRLTYQVNRTRDEALSVQTDLTTPADPSDNGRSTRPPMPLPNLDGECPYMPPHMNAEGYNKGEAYAYAEPRDTDIDRSAELIDILKAEESIAYCHCGMKISDSELPDGWTVHRSRYQATLGRVFFASPEDKTFWQLPASILAKLTDDQRKILANLKQSTD